MQRLRVECVLREAGGRPCTGRTGFIIAFEGRHPFAAVSFRIE